MINLVVFTGAGVSADSGVSTFRDSDGLWEKYKIEDVCTPQAWENNTATVIDFYNQRRKQLDEVSPNAGHFAIADLERYFKVQVITQNVDDLHERAGSSNVLHLHGELRKVRSCINPDLIQTLDGWELKIGDKATDGTQLRPHIVFFGEAVPMYEKALEIVKDADIFIIVGTSLNVYPAAGLLNYVPENCDIYVVDPGDVKAWRNVKEYIRKRSAEGVPILARKLIESLGDL